MHLKLGGGVTLPNVYSNTDLYSACLHPLSCLNLTTTLLYKVDFSQGLQPFKLFVFGFVFTRDLQTVVFKQNSAVISS